MVTENSFALLDLYVTWDKSGELEFQVHRKKNQQLKYLNKESTHVKSTLEAILNGVLKLWAKLTSRAD